MRIDEFEDQKTYPGTHSLLRSVPGLQGDGLGNGRGGVFRRSPRRKNGCLQEDIPEKAATSGGGVQEGGLLPPGKELHEPRDNRCSGLPDLGRVRRRNLQKRRPLPWGSIRSGCAYGAGR